MVNNSVLAINIMIIRRLDNDVVSAAYLSLSRFGSISKQNMSFDKLSDSQLISDKGMAIDGSLFDALSFVIDERTQAGSFN